MKASIAALLLAVSLPSAAQTPYLVKDINTTLSREQRSSSPSSFVRFSNRIYFAATTPAEGTELWSTDGTAAGTRLVSDVVPGTASSNPFGLVVVNSVLLFVARDANHGIEWWTTDGTADGTHLFMDINPGPSSGQPSSWIAYKNRLIFGADDGVNGRELWTTDGTPAGTRLLKDLNPGSASGFPAYPALLNDTVYFSAASALWKTDGTEAGTVKVASGLVRSLVAAGSRLFFESFSAATGWELWTSDGTDGGTRMLTEIRPGPTGAFDTLYLLSFIVAGNRVVFLANDGVHGRELWSSDGTVAGTLMLRDFLPGSKGLWDTAYIYSAVFGNRVYFSGYDAEHGQELWSTDGTEGGTALFLDLLPDARSSNPGGLTVSGGKLFFATSELGVHGGPALYASDGTAAGTHVIGGDNEFARRVNPYGAFSPIDGKVYFPGADPLHGTEPWVSDGTENGTQMIANLAADDAPSAGPGMLTRAGNLVFFYATEGLVNPKSNSPEYSFWRSDGTAPGTFKLMESGQHPPQLISAGSLVFFRLNNNTSAWWLSDGTVAGTRLADDFFRRFGGLKFETFLPVGETLYASVFDHDTYDAALWKTTGTLDAPATRLGAREPFGMIDVGGHAMFYAQANRIYDYGLWTTDGTPAGTYAVVPYLGDTASQGSGTLANAGGTVFFIKTLRDELPKLWKSDGTFDGTTVVKELPAPLPGTFRTEVTAAGRKAFFNTGGALWVSDGTAAGTTEFRRVKFYPSNQSDNLRVAGDRIVFTPWDEATSTFELWGSDGTPEGTTFLRKLGNGVFPLTSIDEIVYFTAFDAEHGSEAWTTDGTPEGTKMLFDLNPGPASSDAGGFAKVGNLLYFSAYTEPTGDELWALPLTQPRLSIADTHAAEGDGSTSLAHFTVSLSPAAAANVSVEYATSDGSARAGDDYDAVSGTLIFAPGETTKTIDVRVRGDVAAENNETFFVTLRNLAGASFRKYDAFAVIDDDDQTADVSVATAIQVESFRLKDPVIATNKGPQTATDVVVKYTTTNAVVGYCPSCSVLQLGNGGSAQISVDMNGSGGNALFKTATVTARQRDPQPANNSVGWVISGQGQMAMNGLYLTPGGTATVTLVNYLPATSMTLKSSDPSVASVPPFAEFAGTTAKTTTFTVTALKPGTTSITAGSSTDAFPVIVVAAGATPRWLGTLSVQPDYYSGGSRFDLPVAFTASIGGTAPFTGATPTGTVIVSAGGKEVARRTLSTTGPTPVQFYPTTTGQVRYQFAYSGDANFLPQTASSDATISSAPVTLLGGLERSAAAGTFTLRVHAKGSPAVPPTGTISVKNGAALLVQLPLSAGFQESAVSATLTNLPASPTLTLQYSGDAFHLASSQEVRVVEPRKRPVKH